jgi:hypothetical protein
MPAPEFTPQTPGDLNANTAPAPETPAPALFVAKHNGGGRWKIWSTAADDWFSDYIATGKGAKEQAETEAERLIAGGEPFVKLAEQQPEAKAAPKSKSSAIDATTIKQPVLTSEGWLCPVPPVKE